MIDEPEDIIVHPRKGRKERELPAEAIMVPNPADAAIAEKIFNERGAEEHFLYNSKLFVDDCQNCCLAGPCLGAAAAGLVLEKLIVLGVRSVSLISCCGAVDTGLKVGDVVVADKGIVGEGLSAYYGGNSRVLPSSTAFLKLKELATRLQLEWKEGAIWSTDAPYRERKSTLKQLNEHDHVIGVDMEFSALCSIAAFRGIEFGGVFIVSDELWGKEWYPGFGSKAFKAARAKMIKGIIAGKINRTVANEKDV